VANPSWACGVPLTTPLLIVNPKGRDPFVIDQVYGGVPPVAVQFAV
jgi:hypothetical protein